VRRLERDPGLAGRPAESAGIVDVPSARMIGSPASFGEKGVVSGSIGRIEPSASNSMRARHVSRLYPLPPGMAWR